MVEMKSSQGTTVSVSEEKAQRLRASGYTDVSKASSNSDVPKRRGRPRKSVQDETSDDAVRNDESGG